MAEKSGTLLESVGQIQPSIVKALHPLWITTVEELVTTAYEDKGRAGLASALQMTPAEVEAMAQDLLPLVPLDVQQQMHIPPRVYGLGALDTFDGGQPKGLFDEEGLSKSLPERVSLVDQMPAIRNQGMRGTCVAHACAALREYQTGQTQANFSEQFLYWAARQQPLIAAVLKNRPGTPLLFGMNALKNYGICTEADWPYSPDPTPGNEEQGPPPADVLIKARAYRIKEYWFLWPRDVLNLKTYLEAGRAIVFTVPTFDIWSGVMSTRTGAIRMPMASEKPLNRFAWLNSTHALYLVGYQDDKTVPGGGYFIVRNSWGTDWATQCPDGPGYCWLPYDYLKRYGLTAFTSRK
jgi:hypothetical protein